MFRGRVRKLFSRRTPLEQKSQPQLSTSGGLQRECRLNTLKHWLHFSRNYGDVWSIGLRKEKLSISAKKDLAVTDLKLANYVSEVDHFNIFVHFLAAFGEF